MTQVSLEFLYGVLRSTLLVYITLVALHFVLEVLFAHRAYRRSLQGFPDPVRPPSVDVIVPCYNEDADHLAACFDALLAQDYEGDVRVYVVDDGSPNREQVLHVYERYGALDGWEVLLPAENRGKRHAQDAALARCRSDIVVTIDSDTEIASDGIRQIVRPFIDPAVGAVTGDVAVTNASTNVLTRLIGMRYWVAFNQERAAQSYFRSVLCCSGPFSAYRRSVLAAVWPSYIAQTFKGTACTYGDDRHLTNLVLAAGSDTLFLPQAWARTNAPETIRGYLKQQLRWNKSFYREVLWTLP
ncbi:MAG TPA: glycosyltransferase family 2 protein, partial [Gaiellales bacterium]|nr:glycosyltransferase family 2 protein [Gaiellales bacterium]